MEKARYNETLERIAPEEINDQDLFAKKSLQLHIERYQFAAFHLQPGRILDIACGTGYGTAILASSSGNTSVTGVDLSGEAIRHATKMYPRHNILFIQKDIFAFTNSELFDTVVSLETIEHIHNPLDVVSHLLNLLKPGGHLIISAPVTPSMDGNPYHVNDFSVHSFKNLFSRPTLKIIEELSQVQPYSIKEVIGSKKINRLKKTDRSLLRFYCKYPRKFFARLQSLFADGFNNKYLTLVIKKEEN
jgi:2-polyprenyl-3-methyl-5-hydroxy-6-metoxy-1,4-benzoquinol methylase